ncbi:MAG: FAD-dependent monooxygenase [Acidobacteriota bacterium]|nr:FAD-dependent monooxygenase [Acidobacteriota bacterium]
MAQSTDVFVIGGGPAGLAAAIAARQRGLGVIVADGNKPPIDKPCGEGLMPDSIAALRELGVELGPRDGFPFGGINFVDGRTSLAANFPSGPGIGLRRTILQRKMLDRAEELGVRFLWHTPVTGIEEGMVRLAGGEAIASRWIVGADGGQSRVRRWAGLDSSGRRHARLACRGHFAVAPWSDYVEIYWGDNAQAYVTPVSASEVCIVMVSRKPSRDLPLALSEFPELARRLKGERPARPERGAFTTTRSLRKVYRSHVALIGDASGSVDAITGEGLSLSFHQAQALADAMAENNLGSYQRVHRQLARRPTFMARLLLLLDGRPRMRRRTFQAFANHPELFARLISIHVGETSPAHFAATGAMLGWRFLAA